MIFMCTYQLDRDKQAETQAFFANMTDEQIAGEYPACLSRSNWYVHMKIILLSLVKLLFVVIYLM